MLRSRVLVAMLGAWLFVGTLALSGCSSQPSEEDLGEIETSRQELPGAGEKYPLPKMKDSAKRASTE